jgi:hypothetical protein
MYYKVSVRNPSWRKCKGVFLTVILPLPQGNIPPETPITTSARRYNPIGTRQQSAVIDMPKNITGQLYDIRTRYKIILYAIVKSARNYGVLIQVKINHERTITKSTVGTKQLNIKGN